MTWRVRSVATSAVLAAAFLGLARDARGAAGPTEAWVARYNGPENSTELANSVAVDGDGDIVVTGSSNGVSDYATVKYDGTTGAQLWSARYNGPGNAGDAAFSVAADNVGNVVVTGGSHGIGTSDDYATVKYDGATGTQLWAARYNGSANSADLALSIAVDGAGNVVVTGYSRNGGNYDYATVKYDAATGAQLWAARYNGPANSDDYAQSIAVDGTGNVVVTGRSVNGVAYDYTTVKYDAATGAQLWATHYNGPANSHDEAYSIELEGAGNAVVTGYSYNGANWDYATVKYDAATGAQLWATRYNGPANSQDYARAIQVDDAGNVVVTGQSHSGANFDYATVKYDAATGAQLWAARYNGPANAGDYGRAIVVDGAGNVVVTGQSQNGANDDYATVKYDAASGAQLWATRYNGPANSNDEARAIAVDVAGNVVATGYSSNGTNNDYATVKYTEPVPATNVTVSCQITRSGLRKNFRTGRWGQVVSVKNMSPSSLEGPISLALDSLTGGVTLFNKTGDTLCAIPAGSPYLNSGASLSPGATASFALEFTNPANGPITYTPRILVGLGQR